VASGEVQVLLDDPLGGVRDPQVHYDGQRLVFSYRPGDSPYYHLYEINADGSGLHQLTDGPYDDLEPTYLLDVSDPEPAINLVDPRWRGDLPATFLYNEKGEMVYKHIGRVKTAELREAIEKLIKKSEVK
jgi:hypothetical protein